MVLTSLEKTYFRGAPGYEAARRATVWNGLLPERFPDVIMQAHDTAVVVTALPDARENGQKVGVRSGENSWAANTCATADYYWTSADSTTAGSTPGG